MSSYLFLLPAFIACLILTGIHTYLGIHIIKRGIIFLDIALAQIAALGMTVALLNDYEIGSFPFYLFALSFSVLGAAIFTFISQGGVKQESLIGIVFVVASSLSILLSHYLSHGSEHIQFILTGNILWVDWTDLLKACILYLIVGVFHYYFRKPFLAVSGFDSPWPEKKWFWNLLFYLTFALVITSSVEIGGILLVFCFLIMPAFASLYFFKTIQSRLIFGWGFGIICSFAGILVSYLFDWPTGPAIVISFGFFLFLSLLSNSILRSSGEEE